MSYAPPPSFDAELGQIFIRMRTLLGINLWDMARAVGGEPTVIANLEAGALDALPPWPELTRLVDNYARLTGVDPQPILSRLLRSQPQAVNAAPPPVPEVEFHPTTPWPMETHASAYPARHTQVMLPAVQHAPAQQPVQLQAAVTADVVSERSRRRIPDGARSVVHSAALADVAEVVPPVARPRRAERAAKFAMPSWRLKRPKLRRLPKVGRQILIPLLMLAGVICIVATARFSPGVLYSVIGPLPALMAEPLRHGVDALVAGVAPVREGLTWIDVDPSLRRGDKLRQRGR